MERAVNLIPNKINPKIKQFKSEVKLVLIFF